MEQFSPLLPGNYQESSYPVALYNWYAENPSDQPVTVSLLFSWTNMVGWFRDRSSGFGSALSNQDKNRYISESMGDGKMQGIVFDRLRTGAVRDEWDGQFAIATNAEPGMEVTHMATFYPEGTGDEVWKPFSTRDVNRRSAVRFVGRGEHPDSELLCKPDVRSIARQVDS